jgi:hypothetical protein
MPRVTGRMQPRRNWPTWAFDHPPYSPDLPSSDYHLFPGLKKTFECSPFFVRCKSQCCRGDLVGRTIFWMFLSDLQKLQQQAKKCIELRGEYVE